MVYLNTNKSLFCGTRVFSSKSMTEEEFLECLNNYLISRGSEEIEDLSHESLDKAYCDAIIEDFEEREDIFYGAVVWMQDYDDVDGQLTFHRLDNGFCYIELYTSGGDDYGNPIYNILYFDENNELCSYVPYYGNLINVLAQEGVLCYNGNDADAFDELTTKYFSRLEKLYGKKKTTQIIDDGNNVINLLCLGWEYGLIGTLPNPDDYDEYDLMDLLEINKDYVVEDILSNVKLV